MTISVPLKDEVTATLRAETSACTDSLAPGCCSRFISSTLLSGLSLATGGGIGGFLRCASLGEARTAMTACKSTANTATFAALPALAELKQPLPRWSSLQLQQKKRTSRASPDRLSARAPARQGPCPCPHRAAGARRSCRWCSLLEPSIASLRLDAIAASWLRKPGAQQAGARSIVADTPSLARAGPVPASTSAAGGNRLQTQLASPIKPCPLERQGL